MAFVHSVHSRWTFKQQTTLFVFWFFFFFFLGFVFVLATVSSLFQKCSVFYIIFVFCSRFVFADCPCSRSSWKFNVGSWEAKKKLHAQFPLDVDLSPQNTRLYIPLSDWLPTHSDKKIIVSWEGSSLVTSAVEPTLFPVGDTGINWKKNGRPGHEALFQEDEQGAWKRDTVYCKWNLFHCFAGRWRRFPSFRTGMGLDGCRRQPRTDVIVTLFGVTYGNGGCPARVSIPNESQGWHRITGRIRITRLGRR